MALNKFKQLFNPIINYFGRKKMRNQFSKQPIIIGGCGRSGTTLLLSIIGAHPKIHAFPQELGSFIDWPQGKPRIDRLHRFVLRNQILETADRWCEKTPGNVRHFAQILDYFDQNVKLIHIVRDGRDVMLSKHPKDPDKYWVSPERWVNDVKAGLEFKDHPQVFTVKYEDLILNYQSTSKKLFKFIGEEYRTELENWVKHTNVQQNKAWSGSVKDLYSSSIEKWKKEENKARVEEVMNYKGVKDLLKRLDYISKEGELE